MIKVKAIKSLFWVAQDNPELMRSQLQAFAKQIPLLYLILTLSTVALSYTHFDSAPIHLTVYIPAALCLISLVRLAFWWNSRDMSVSAARARSLLQQTVIMTVVLGVCFTAWAFALFPYGNDFAKAHVAFYLGITVLGCIFCLMHVRIAALLVGAVVIVPFAVFFVSTGNPVLAAMALNLTLVAGAMILVLMANYRGFAELIAMQRDLVDKQAETQRLNDENFRLANLDVLTDLPNRRRFFAEFEVVIEQARSFGIPFTVGLVDLDGFKPVNDLYGHGAGDRVLVEVGRRLTSLPSPSAFIARLGGDEFGLLLERCSLEDGLRVVESLRQLVEDFRFVWNNRAFGIGASIGLVELDSRIQTLEEALAAADQACFAAKDLGRNRIHVYQADDREVVRHQGEMDWASRLTQAVEENRLLLYAQPVVPLVSGISSCLRFEVFLRLLNERGEVVLPEVFLPAAERFNLMPRLDRWAIDAACSGLRRLLDQESHPSLQCGINLSVQTVGRPETLEYIGERLQHYDIAPACLCFEVAEAAASRQFAEVQTFAQGLRQLGCGFAFDAFGSGLSSFAYLRALPPDYVKIDGDLIHRMTDDRVSQTLVRAIHDISRQLGVAAVAEMVDDAAVFAMVREIGIELGQGTWFDPPQLFEDWLAVCEARHVNGEAGVYSILPSPAA